ncbi:DinB family protein [Undibacterium sp. CY18W]|uniref:DinB family protein n=1 Tax=Undibacterium hunanense TaxID=2762292 RepID=A0ABR6ZW10_9BURK|nr:DinB family protein [Undibacterium hunanense]MBC3920005.1 DinB family protein [Undibacterium hunanense]
MNTLTLDALASFPQQLEAHYSLIPQGFQHWAPASWDGVPSEPFTAIEQVCHIRDIEIEGYHLRFERTLNEHHPLLASIDSEPLAKERDYAGQDVAEVFASFRAARLKTMGIIRDLHDAQLNRTAEFEGYGPLTLRSLIHYLCSHDQQHLAGLQWLLGKIEASRSR